MGGWRRKRGRGRDEEGGTLSVKFIKVLFIVWRRSVRHYLCGDKRSVKHVATECVPLPSTGRGYNLTPQALTYEGMQA